MVLSQAMKNKAYWVAFSHVKGIGAVRFRRLIDFFGDLSVAWQAPYEAFLSAGLSEKNADQIMHFRNTIDPFRLCENIEKQGIQILTWEDEGYPRRLNEVDQSPPVIYLKGSITGEDDWAIAIVGTRRMTGYGKQVTSELAAFLALHGVTVVSGLARGIDAVAHEAALTAGGRTMAVLGCGVDMVYPPEHKHLSEKIMAQGALLSDYAPGTLPEGVNFPPRNRLISGLSLATIVVEAGMKSGALITSTFAVEQGRDVFAVPGNIYAPQCKGTNYLIQQGARPLIDFDELLDILQLQKIQHHQAARQYLPENEIEQRLLALINDQPMHIDEIQNLIELPMSQISSALVMLELKGMVYQAGTMNYARVRETASGYGSEDE